MQKHVGPERRTLLAIERRAANRIIHPVHPGTGARSRRALVERQKKKKRRRMISRIGIAVLVLLAIVFAPTIFFQVSKINVTAIRAIRVTAHQVNRSQAGR